MNLRDIIRQAAKDDQEIYSVPAVIKSVDLNKGTCEVVSLVDDKIVYHAVRLQAKAGKGIIAVPKKGSDVIITFMGKYDAFVSMVSDVDKYIMENADESLMKLLSDLLDAILQLTVSTSLGPSGVPINAPVFQQIKQRVTKFFAR